MSESDGKVERRKPEEVSPESKVVERASDRSENEVNSDMPSWIADKQKDAAAFKAAGLLDKPRGVSEDFGRLQLEDQDEIIVKGLVPKSVQRETVSPDSPSEAALKAAGEADPLADSLYQVRKGIKKHLVDGPEKEAALKTARKTEKELLYSDTESHHPSDESMEGNDSLPAISPKEANSKMLEGQVQKSEALENNPLGWLNAAQKLATLPIDKQIQVIGSGLSAGASEYHRQYAERSIGAVIGGVQGVGTIAENLAKIADFSAYLLINDNERASAMGAEFGEALGGTIVGGLRFIDGAHHYLNEVGKAGYEGDYTKVFRDVVNLGDRLDKAWSDLPPREQSRIISKLSTELAADGLIGLGAAKTAGQIPGRFTKILGIISDDVEKAHIAGRKITGKSVDAIKDAVEPLTEHMRRGFGPQFAHATAYPGSRIDVGKALDGVRKPIERAVESIDKALEKPIEELSNKMAPYFEWGKKRPVKRSRAAELTGLEEKEITQKVKENPDFLEDLTDGQLIYMRKQYRDLYLEANPQYMGMSESFEVHHKLPQELLKRHPGWFSPRDIHRIENLVGIPNDTGTHEVITREWMKFFQKTPNRTKQQIIDFAADIDKRYGGSYLP